MGGKHHLLGLHPSPLRPQRAPLRRDHPAMLKNLQLFRQRAQKPKRVEPGLSFQPGRPLHGKRELRLQCEGTLQAQPGGGMRLLPDRILLLGGIEEGGAVLPLAWDLPLSHQPPVGFHGPLVGRGILPCRQLPLLFGEPLVDHAVLRRDFGRGVPSLTAGQPVGLQQQHLCAPLPQEPGCEHTGHSSAHYRYLCTVFPFQRRPGGKGYGFTPNGPHFLITSGTACASRSKIMYRTFSRPRRHPL